MCFNESSSIGLSISKVESKTFQMICCVNPFSLEDSRWKNNGPLSWLYRVANLWLLKGYVWKLVQMKAETLNVLGEKEMGRYLQREKSYRAICEGMWKKECPLSLQRSINALKREWVKRFVALTSCFQTNITQWCIEISLIAFFPLKEEYLSFDWKYKTRFSVARCQNERKKFGEPTARRTLYLRCIKTSWILY